LSSNISTMGRRRRNGAVNVASISSASEMSINVGPSLGAEQTSTNVTVVWTAVGIYSRSGRREGRS
jgi:hypothetical protein